MQIAQVQPRNRPSKLAYPSHAERNNIPDIDNNPFGQTFLLKDIWNRIFFLTIMSLTDQMSVSNATSFVSDGTVSIAA